MQRVKLALAAALVFVSGAAAQNRPAFSDVTRQFITVDAPVVVLQHVRLIDGTGGPVTENQTIVIDNTTIRSVGPDSSASIPAGAHVMDLTGRTVIPGLIGMHDHTHYAITGPSVFKPGLPLIWAVPTPTTARLYLANGVTSVRPAGTWEPDTDINTKREIDAGNMPGPTIYVTGPFLDGSTHAWSDNMYQNHVLSGPEDATREVNFWIDQGVMNFKAYQGVTRAELAAMVKAAHARGAKIEIHPCAVDWPEIIAIGADSIEHGILWDTEFTPGRQPDVCPPRRETEAAIAKLDVQSKPVQDLIHDLVQHHIAVTSALPTYYPAPGLPIQPGVLRVLSQDALNNFLTSHTLQGENTNTPAAQMRAAVYRTEVKFEQAFVKAGGQLMGGPDPGQGGSLQGFEDLQELELLVDSDEFSPAEAVRIYSHNGAEWLGVANKVGTVQAGMQADLVVVKGDPSRNIKDVENTEIVFKGGVGFDPQKLLQSIQGLVGII